MKDQLILIDGHALAYRMFFALPIHHFSTEAGEPTNATYGFARTLLDLILAKEPPKYLAVSFDVGKTFRDEMFPEYKGTREKMPDELQVQIERIKQLVEALNIPVLTADGFEADDVLGTIARQAKALKTPVKIITGDRDLLQLVDDNTIVELPPGQRERQPQAFDMPAVEEKYGVKVSQFVDYKALVGDSSDNIPGVRGVGQKTAVKLLGQYHTLDGIYENVDEVKGRMGQNLAEGKENAYLSQALSRIVTDVPIKLDLAACVSDEFDAGTVLTLFRELEFRSLTSRFLEATEAVDDWQPPEQQGTETHIVRAAKELNALAKKLGAADVIAFDLETTSLNKIEAEIVGFAFSVEEGEAFYVPVGHLLGKNQAESGQMDLFAGTAQLAPNQLPLPTVLEAIRPAMTDADIPKVAHNAKYDYAILNKFGVQTTPVTFDTMIGEWLLNPSSRFLGLKDLTRQALGIEMIKIEELIGKGKSQVSFAQTEIEDAAPYAAADADMTLRLMNHIQPKLEETGLIRLMQELEMPLMPVLSDMEQTGVGVDVAWLEQMAQQLSGQLQILKEEIIGIAGEDFNINSTQQLSQILFQKLDLPHEKLRRTSSGHYSTANDVLQGLKPVDETGIVDRVLLFRELGKLKSTYVDALPAMVSGQTGRIHTNFNQTGSVTGRLASSNPNLQNIPIRSEVGRQIRRAFVARPGWTFLAADYSQVELRVLAHISQDSALMEAFRQDQDIHQTTAATVYGVDLDEVSFEQRRFAKAVNFGLIYGMGAFRLARDSDLTLAEAEEFIKVYFERFPGIQEYLEQTKAKAREEGFVETLLGRRRYFPIFKVRSGANRQALMRAEREAINHPIQGTAADIIKIAMIQLHHVLKTDYRAKMLLQVHDELLVETPEEEVESVKALVTKIMAEAYQLDVPLKVESSVGDNWLALKE